MIVRTAFLALALAPTLVVGQSYDDCRFEAQRSARVDAGGARLVEVAARSGSLEVVGRAGLSEVRVRGRACASSQSLLDALQIETRRSAGTVRVQIPEIEYDGSYERRYARLDLIIEVPAGIAGDIADGSGSTIISGLGQLSVSDGSGDLQISDIRGPVTIHDGSGGIRLERVRGDVEIHDGSGEIDVREITGSVTVSDGSGSIRALGVSGSVRVAADGSGSVEVDDVGGDLIVDAGRYERIRFAGVRGTVDIPQPRRRR